MAGGPFVPAGLGRPADPADPGGPHGASGHGFPAITCRHQPIPARLMTSSRSRVRWRRRPPPQVVLARLRRRRADGCGRTGVGPARRRAADPARRWGTFETSFGYDFSDVRVHTGATADDAARRLGAEAFTLGNDIAFAQGRFDPTWSVGTHLLAHELAHVVQAGGQAGQGTAIHRFASYSPASQTDGRSAGWRHPTTDSLRVSDDGQMAVEDRGWGHTPTSAHGLHPRLSRRRTVCSPHSSRWRTCVPSRAARRSAARPPRQARHRTLLRSSRSSPQAVDRWISPRTAALPHGR